MPAPLRLLHVFSTFAVGGPQARSAELIHAFGPALEHVLVAADGRMEALRAFGLAGLARPLPLAFVKGRAISPSNLIHVRRLLRSERPALLLTYNFGALEAALANRFWPFCPHVHHEDGFGPEESAGRQLRRRVWLRHLALSDATRIVVPSQTLLRLALQDWGFGPELVTHIPNGIDLDRFSTRAPSDSLAPIGRRPGELLVGTVGSLRPEKNLARLLRIFAVQPTRPPVRLVIVGEGTERERLKAQASELGQADRVVFTGQIDRPERILSQLDLFALSSDTEQMPVSLLEAMAAGLPVVATEVGDVALMLPRSQRAFVIEPAREKDLADAMTRLLADPSLRRHLGAENRAHVSAHFGRARMIEQYRALYAHCIGAAGARALPLDRRVAAG
jgi:glycosyltransferase involved in cell wall biosynthesis